MLEIHEKKSQDGYEKIISQIGAENVKIIESYSSDVVDGYGVYSAIPGKITVYDYDGSDIGIIDGIIRTILFKGQFKGINECEFALLDESKYGKLITLKFVSETDKTIHDIAYFMNNCKKCKEIK